MKPQQVKVCVSLDTGGVVLMAIVLDDGRNVQREATQEYVDALIAQSSAHGWKGKPTSWRFIKDSDLPPSREFREAWEDKDGKVQVNPIKEQAIRSERELDAKVRAAEAERLAQLRNTLRVR